jgi:ABC-type Fe3+/spermidine/putrescine transport system ATPase subunit
MTRFLSIEALRARAGAFRLGPIDLGMEEGEQLVLLGPSGCGKTTLLRTLLGAQPLAGGAVRVEGRDLSERPVHRRRFAYVAQKSDLFPHLTVRQNIAFGLRYRGLPRRERHTRTDELAELVGAGDLLGRRPGGLSGGETRRVALARSLGPEPRLLLLDEPLSMLDPNAREAMIATLTRLHETLGTTVIHVTHDREEAWLLQGRCAVMHRGRILQTGTAQTLFREPATVFVAQFLGGRNILPATFAVEDGAHIARTPAGRFPLAEAPPAEAGFVQIRAEDLRVQPAGKGEQAPGGGVDALVEEIIDRGVYRELRTRAGSHPLVVHTTARDGLPGAGERIRLHCRAPAHPVRAETTPQREGPDE